MNFKQAEIGLVPKDWHIEDLRHFLDLITYGFTNPMPDANDGPWKLTAKDIVDGRINYVTARRTTLDAFTNKLSNKSKPKIGDVLLTKDGSIGRVAVVDKENLCINQSVALLRPNKLIDPYFLKYLLSSHYYQQVMENDSDGSTIKHIYITRVDKMQVAIPPLKKQKDILKILGSLDDRIELLRKTNSTIESIAQTFFKSWFVDFDPVRAKSEGREPEGMDEKTAALFPDGFEESDLETIPKSWHIKKIGDVIQVLGGGTPSTKETKFWCLEEHHWATPKDLSNIATPILLSTDRKISSKGLEKISSGLLPVNTVLMSSRAPIGYLAIAKIPTAINQGFIAIPPHTELSSVFLLLWCQQNMALIKQKANGSTFMEISKSAFRPIPILYPPCNILHKFTELTSVLFDRITENERQAQLLISLRDTLLPRLISGQLQIPENSLSKEKV